MARTNTHTPILPTSEWEDLISAVNENANIVNANSIDIDDVRTSIEEINNNFLTDAEGSALALVIALS